MRILVIEYSRGAKKHGFEKPIIFYNCKSSEQYNAKETVLV